MITHTQRLIFEQLLVALEKLQCASVQFTVWTVIFTVSVAMYWSTPWNDHDVISRVLPVIIQMFFSRVSSIYNFIVYSEFWKLFI